MYIISYSFFTEAVIFLLLFKRGSYYMVTVSKLLNVPTESTVEVKDTHFFKNVKDYVLSEKKEKQHKVKVNLFNKYCMNRSLIISLINWLEISWLFSISFVGWVFEGQC